MAKQYFKPGNMLYPLPAVMVSCQYPAGKEDALCTNPALAGKPNIMHRSVGRYRVYQSTDVIDLCPARNATLTT